MKNAKFLILFSVFFSSAIISGCKKDDNNQPKPETGIGISHGQKTATEHLI